MSVQMQQMRTPQIRQACCVDSFGRRARTIGGKQRQGPMTPQMFRVHAQEIGLMVS